MKTTPSKKNFRTNRNALVGVTILAMASQFAPAETKTYVSGTLSGGDTNDLILMGSNATDNTLIFTGNLGTGTNTLQIYLRSNGNINVVNQGATLDIDTRIRNAGADSDFGFTKTGAGTLVLRGENDYRGGTTIEEGVIVIRNSNALGTGGLTINGGALAAGVISRTISNNLTVGGDFALGGGKDKPSR